MLRSHIFRQSWPNVVERKVQFSALTFNLNTPPPTPPPPPPVNVVWDYFLLGISITQSQLVTLGSTLKRVAGEFLFREISDNIITRAPLPFN